MANNYFHFKQFRIAQDRCAMKVGTDGVLLGAWANPNPRGRLLDVGTGTGLIALMVAQRFQDLQIEAIELDAVAYGQALENLRASPFSDRLVLQLGALQHFSPEKLYDDIICNPPYFEGGTPSANKARNQARHDDSLTLEDFIRHASRMTESEARLHLILPESRWPSLHSIAKSYGWHLQRTTAVRPSTNGLIKRRLITLSRERGEVLENSFYLEEERHVRSQVYQDLTQAFYL